MTPGLSIIGGGLAGSEAAWQIAQAGFGVHLYEMRPKISTGAHETAFLSELICSNSLGSNLPHHASGVLKNELRRMGSLLINCAEAAALPAGSALAVDRLHFAQLVTEQITAHPNIELVRKEMKKIPPGPTIIASGPLTSPSLSTALSLLTGEEFLYFYDAIAPIVVGDTINTRIAFRASRYGIGDNEEGDYLNCPLNEEEYDSFVDALIKAKCKTLRSFEKEIEKGVKSGSHVFFEGCLPIEVIARRGLRSLAFGPMRPIGLKDPRTAKGAHAIVQLRQDNLAGELYNLVGFQTNLTFTEQKRVFRLIPGLEEAEFIRMGQMHRNTFIASPKLLWATLQYRSRPDLFFAGQITGVEGYMGNIATGLLAGRNMVRFLKGQTPASFPVDTMLGALCHYITHASMKDFQPMKANFGILPPLSVHTQGKLERSRQYAERAQLSLENYLEKLG